MKHDYLQIGMGFAILLNDTAVELLVNVKEDGARKRMNALRLKHILDLRVATPFKFTDQKYNKAYRWRLSHAPVFEFDA